MKNSVNSNKKNYLLCYDIRDEKRLLKLHKYMISQLIPVQKSVFYGLINEHDLARIIEETLELISVSTDDVRVYRVAKFSEALTLGTNKKDLETLDWGMYFAENNSL